MQPYAAASVGKTSFQLIFPPPGEIFLHRGEASVCPHTQHPGGIARAGHPAPGLVVSTDALTPVETVLLQTLKEYAIWCLEAMTAIGSPDSK